MDTSVKQFLDEMKDIQTSLLDFLDHGDNMEEKYQNLKHKFDDIKIHYNQFQIKSLFYLILKISNNHHRESEFFDKIEKVLQLFKDDMKKYFHNNEIFHIFESNKRLLLFLLEENMMIMDRSIVHKICNNPKYIKAKYPQYFQPEIQPFTNEKWLSKYEEKELTDDFYKKRKIGENDDEICTLIQKDLIEEFIIYVNKNCYPINSTINSSIYETNNFLLKNNDLALIEYAVFFGSIQIFNYLRQNGAELKSSLWLYAVHGKDPEIINFLEESKIIPSKDSDISFVQIFKESIKCHHIDVANYIQNNYLQYKIESSNDTLSNSLKYYNFMFMQYVFEKDNSFFYFCKYDYYILAFILLKNTDIDINKKLVLLCFFLIGFKILSFNEILI